MPHQAFVHTEFRLDALEPSVLTELIREAVEDCVDDTDAMEAREQEIEDGRARLQEVAEELMS